MAARIWPQVTTMVRRQLALGAVLGVLVPIAIAEVVKSGLQPGLHDQAAKLAQMVDFVALGAIFFALSMVATVLLGVLIVASMKGPRHVADGYAAEGADAWASDDLVGGEGRR